MWTPDGREVIYGRPRPGAGWDIFRKPADGSGSEQELWQGHWIKCRAAAIRRDGQLFPFAEWSLDTAADIHFLSMKDADRGFLKGPEFELNVVFARRALRRLCVHRAGHPGGVHSGQ